MDRQQPATGDTSGVVKWGILYMGLVRLEKQDTSTSNASWYLGPVVKGKTPFANAVANAICAYHASGDGMDQSMCSARVIDDGDVNQVPTANQFKAFMDTVPRGGARWSAASFAKGQARSTADHKYDDGPQGL